MLVVSPVVSSDASDVGIRASVVRRRAEAMWSRGVAAPAVHGGVVSVRDGNECSGVALLRRCLWLLLVELWRTGAEVEPPNRKKQTGCGLGLSFGTPAVCGSVLMLLCALGGAFAFTKRMCSLGVSV